MAVVCLAELFDKINRIKNREARIEELKKYDNFTVKTILQGALDPRIQWDLPEGAPPYNPSNLLDQEANIIFEAKKLAMFAVNPNNNLRKSKKEQLFIAMLERLDPRDAAMLITVKDRKFFRNITKEVVRAAFPNDDLVGEVIDSVPAPEEVLEQEAV